MTTAVFVTRDRLRILGSLAAALVLLATASCDSSDIVDLPTPPDPTALFLVDSCPDQIGETFRVLMRDPVLIVEAERLIATGEQRIITGALVAGDGGFNAPWSWHMDPDTLEFVDATIEVCSGCASFVEDDLDQWLQTIGTYCPWGARFLEREQ